ncbi:MAG: DUF1549 domain-containing protein [Verrucomicrobiaceae bacterium]|nr:DUF1549 domain-containing protein [Verrucomicrobiaceae bacterium]
MPILQSRCYECHSQTHKIKGGLALDSKSGWQSGGDHGAAIIPGDLDQSHLIKAIRYLDPEMEMPPKGKLAADEIALLERWVAMGAPDSRVAGPSKKPRVIDLAEGRKFWSYQPVGNYEPPSVKDTSWPQTDVDRFILAKQEAEGLSPAPEADAYTLLRRISLDLTGLPPTPQMMAELRSGEVKKSRGIQASPSSSPPFHLSTSHATAADRSYEVVVDQLLASPAFGERWARHWLDLTGYADQIGTSNNVFAEHAWRYRDYVINAFNSDKPFDQFIREQVAGDLLAKQESDPAKQAEMITATGFLVLGDVEIVAVDKLKMEHDLIDNQISKIGTAFLGQTLGCVRCHDHKFDPIGLQDYYAIAGMFRSTDSTYKTDNGVWSSVNKTELPETPAQRQERQQRLDLNQASIDRWKSEREDATKRLADLDKQIASASGEPKAALQKQRDELDKQHRTLSSQIEHARFFAPVAAKAFAVRDVAKPADMHITIRGNPYALGDEVRRGTLRVASWDKFPVIPANESGRVQLANWIADRRNPLTARVIVNRVWQKLFGEGIVRSVDYFGTRGDPPTHPELLDYLATKFMREGWSVKRLVRELVLSRTYRQSSMELRATGEESNPLLASREASDSKLLALRSSLLSGMNRRRLDAESLRDSMLAITDHLTTSGRGPALPLEYPENVTSISPKAVNPPAFNLKKMRPIQDFERTIYLPVIRTAAQPGSAKLRDVFDFVQPALISGKRAETAVPTQALFLLNSDLIRTRATELAALITQSSPDTKSRLEALWLRVLNRPLTSAERTDSETFIASMPADKAWIELSHALLSSNEFLLRQ